MTPTREKTLEDLCIFISDKAVKPDLKPIKLFGNNCKKAAIFRHLKQKMKEDTQELRPSSLISKYLDKGYNEIMFESFRLAPKLDLTFNYQANKMSEIGFYFTMIGFLSLIFSCFLMVTTIVLFAFSTLAIGIITIIESEKYSPRKCELKEAKTFRDLVYLIQENQSKL